MAKEYYPTIGLEIHAELKTQTKMFCNSKNDPEESRPNVNICAVCLGHPGTLPTVNKEAVLHVIKVGLAVGGKIADYSEFDRKNYFYPDIPKGYQISQYKYPLVEGGELSDVALTRVHLEEDTAQSFHKEGEEENFSLVDFNRAGVPLMELVTEPVIKSATQAKYFAQELQLLLKYLGASDANMEKGEMRVEANVSISTDPKILGKKVEVKNLNSFRAVEDAINFELARHKVLLEEGKEVIQETRGWNEDKGETFSQRRKEESHDYRYFPDPDIPKLTLKEVKEFDLEELRIGLPELPSAKRDRLERRYGLKREDIELYVQDTTVGNFFESVSTLLTDAEQIKLGSNYIASDLVGLMNTGNADTHIKPVDFAQLVMMITRGEVSSRGAKDILKIMHDTGGTPKAIAEEHELFQESNEEALLSVVNKIISENQTVVADYHAGKTAALQFLVGQCMKATKGSANPGILQQIIKKTLSKEV